MDSRCLELHLVWCIAVSGRPEAVTPHTRHGLLEIAKPAVHTQRSGGRQVAAEGGWTGQNKVLVSKAM